MCHCLQFKLGSFSAKKKLMDKARSRLSTTRISCLERASKATDGRGTVVNVEPLSLPSSVASEPHLLLRDSLPWNCIAYGTPNFLGAGGTIKQLVTTFLERVGYFTISLAVQ